MRSSSGTATNVVRFPGRRSGGSSQQDQKSLMDTVYTSGSICVAADDFETKALASRLQIFGFITIDEVQADGTVRRLRASEAARAAACPWRVSRPSLSYG